MKMKDKIDWYWTPHIKEQMIERDIAAEDVEAALNYPDEIVPGKNHRKIYQKMTAGKLLRVVTEERRLLTVYLTGKLNKYIKGGGE
jgi:hypothetical protein